MARDLRARRPGEAEAMAQVSAALARSLDSTQLYDLILQQALSLLPGDRARVVLYQEGWAAVTATLGGANHQPGTRLFPLDGPEEVWIPSMTAGPVNLGDMAAEPTWKDLSAAAVLEERITAALRNARLLVAEQEQRAAAEELARMRDDFVASVSHELRTPLSTIIGFTELLQARWSRMDDAKRLAQIDKIVSAANRQQRLVADLLLLSAVDLAMPSPRADREGLPQLVGRATQEIRQTYAGQRIDMIGPDTLAIQSEGDRVLQILVNIVDNAAKYSPEGRPITVSWRVEDGMAALRLRDLGQGVPLSALGQLFTRFGRIPGSRTRAGQVGTGLDLYLSRRLAEMVGGDLALDATSAEGSTFRLHLPLWS